MEKNHESKVLKFWKFDMDRNIMIKILNNKKKLRPLIGNSTLNKFLLTKKIDKIRFLKLKFGQVLWHDMTTWIWKSSFYLNQEYSIAKSNTVVNNKVGLSLCSKIWKSLTLWSPTLWSPNLWNTTLIEFKFLNRESELNFWI